MSGDYETLEINQPKISYFRKRSQNNTEWLDEVINKIEDMKEIYLNIFNNRKRVEVIREICKRKWIQWRAKRYIYLREVIGINKE